MMTKLRAWLALPLFYSTLTHGASTPGVLIDFTRLAPPFGISSLPAPLSRRLAQPTQHVALSWALIEPNAEVMLGFVETAPFEIGDLLVMRAMVLKIPSFEAYQELVAEHPELAMTQEIVDVLRSRRREVGLDSRLGESDVATTAVVVEDHRVQTELPSDALPRSIKLRAVEAIGEGEFRLSLSGSRANGETFTKSVIFENLEEFNRASGENVVAADFHRQTLLFWLHSDGSKMDGRFAMKTRAETDLHCAELLRIGVKVRGLEKPAPEGPNAGGGSNSD